MKKALSLISAAVLTVLVILVAAAPYFTAYDPLEVDLSQVLNSPGQEHFMGTDQLGRDLWTRLLYGGRVSMLVALTSVAVSLLVGVSYGAISGYLGGWSDRVMMRILDALLSLPSLLVMMIIQSFIGASLWSVILIIGLTSWMQTARLVRTELMSLKERTFIIAARAVGTRPWAIVWDHLVPHCAPTVIVMGAVGVGHAVLSEATLSFLGLGVPPHQPSWGNMLIGAQNSVLSGAWWVALFPGIMIITLVLVVTFLGDVLQDWLMPGLPKGEKTYSG